ncbi:hypothetical protein [Streptomyces sp. NPDC001508]|uniref:hypothetical protein n=1 Tax=Streptomyces sp. NPDC001508 TaxID=3154656 RepID=UPI003330D14A
MISPKSSARDQYEHLRSRAHQTRELQLHDAHHSLGPLPRPPQPQPADGGSGHDREEEDPSWTNSHCTIASTTPTTTTPATSKPICSFWRR